MTWRDRTNRKTCRFVPSAPNPEAFFRVFDLFAMTSREDPFSVAMLEAAAMAR
jgi:hypothetical protein